MTPNPLDEIAARADKATEGPWRLGGSGIIAVAGVEYLTSCVRTDADAEFIAHAREDVPALVAALRAVEAVHTAGCGCPGCDCVGEDGRPVVCGTCNEYYPCPTITAVREALNGWLPVRA